MVAPMEREDLVPVAPTDALRRFTRELGTWWLAAALAASPLHAQPRAESELDQLANPLADQLEQAGNRLAEDPANFREAASAYEQAARLRGWADPHSADLLT